MVSWKEERAELHVSGSRGFSAVLVRVRVARAGSRSGIEGAFAMPVPGDKYDGDSSFTEDNERVRVSSTDGEHVSESAAQVKEEEEEECGFCIFMKQGPCGERFKLWQDCVEGAEKEEKDIVEQCAQVTTLLKACMEMNPQYYGPVLEAEKAMEADLASSDKTSSDGAESSEPPAGREEGAESENGEYPIETTEVSVDVVDREGQVVESVDVVEVEVKSNIGKYTSESRKTHDRSVYLDGKLVKFVCLLLTTEELLIFWRMDTASPVFPYPSMLECDSYRCETLPNSSVELTTTALAQKALSAIFRLDSRFKKRSPHGCK